MVKLKDIPQITLAIKRISECPDTNKSCNSKLTFLVVGKRHHARLNPVSGKDGKNGPPGIFINETVVCPMQFNIYPQSYHSPKSRGHYVVLHNESGYNGLKLQEALAVLISCAIVYDTTCGLCSRIRFLPVPDGNKLRSYASDNMVWGGGRNCTGAGVLRKLNPWHDNVKDIMFCI
ncbi:uncharacterized protein RAG0_13694 [Rhynchosporium agropyri]|uniref:Piwi domain-containing protein n=1 Tax=Rhynchosporium agropyri TaxID=914238 RepID=A0A1E1LDS1_9HELO|nr:uncharacterized protein RAG0_13694 [Rhynchosporium agropyri]